MEFEALDYLTGIFTALLAGLSFVLLQCRRHLRNLLRLRVQPVVTRQLPMELRTVPADWIKSGSPVFKSCEYAETPDKRTSSGIWSCEGPSSFEWQFGSDEFVMILDGRVEVEYLGQKIILESGASALFYAGTRAVWTVPKYVRKSYVVHYPNYLVRLSRRVLGVASN